MDVHLRSGDYVFSFKLPVLSVDVISAFEMKKLILISSNNTLIVYITK